MCFMAFACIRLCMSSPARWKRERDEGKVGFKKRGRDFIYFLFFLRPKSELMSERQTPFLLYYFGPRSCARARFVSCCCALSDEQMLSPRVIRGSMMMDSGASSAVSFDPYIDPSDDADDEPFLSIGPRRVGSAPRPFIR